jgi:FkbM family methyltransferase
LNATGKGKTSNFLLRFATLPIFHGPLRGKRWLIPTRSNFFLGTYEPRQTQAFLELVRTGDVVYDVGAHYGYYTLLASKLVGPSGAVFAFEPSPTNASYLRMHVHLNRCRNVTILETAIGDREGNAKFETRTGSGTAHLSPAGLVEVPVTSLDAIAQKQLPPRIIKIDVEGAELDALSGARLLIAAHKPAILLSTHSDALRASCLEFLRSLGYSVETMREDEFLARCV